MKFSSLSRGMLGFTSLVSSLTLKDMAPSSSTIQEIFQPLSVQGQQAKFFEHVSNNVTWTILGHSPLSRTYDNKEDFYVNTIAFLTKSILKEPLRLQVVRVIGGGDSEWAAIEMNAIDAECNNGLKYDMVYNWVVKFDSNNIITDARAYLDTKLLTDAIEQNT